MSSRAASRVFRDKMDSAKVEEPRAYRKEGSQAEVEHPPTTVALCNTPTWPPALLHPDLYKQLPQEQVSYYLTSIFKEKLKLIEMQKELGFPHQASLAASEEVASGCVSVKELGMSNGAAASTQGGGDAPPCERVVLLREKIYVPVDEYPNYNFVGRILGPRGMTAKRLEETTGCRIMVRGRTQSSNNKVDCSQGDAHDSGDRLHVIVQCEAPESVAKEKLEKAVQSVRCLLTPPDGKDEFKRRQLLELAIINGTYRATPVTQAYGLSKQAVPSETDSPKLVASRPRSVQELKQVGRVTPSGGKYVEEKKRPVEKSVCSLFDTITTSSRGRSSSRNFGSTSPYNSIVNDKRGHSAGLTLVGIRSMARSSTANAIAKEILANAPTFGFPKKKKKCFAR